MSTRRTMPRGNRTPSARLAWIVTALLALLGTATAAYGFWASTTSGSHAATAADTLSPGSRPEVSATGASLSVSWAGGTTVSGHPATGYTVTRYSTPTGGTGTPATGECAGTVTTLGCTEQNVPGGIWYYTVTPAIALWTGAESPRSTGTSSDSAAPSASVSAISPTPNSAGWNSTSPVTVTITADDGPDGSGVASITYAVDGGAQQTVDGAVTTIPVAGDGTHTVSYFATDNAGNAGAAQSQTVRIDTTAPAAPGLDVPAYINAANAAAVAVTGTAEAGSTISLTISDAGAAHSVTVTATASDSGAWSASPDLAGFDEGAVSFSATAIDPAGNTGPARTAASTKDTLAPAPAQALAVPAYVNTANAAAVPVSGTAEAGATVTVTASDAGAAHTATGTATSTGTGGWSLNLDLSALNDGTATYTATVRDAAGNTSNAATASDIKDTVAPALTITAPMYVNKANAAAVPVSGITEARTVVSVTVRSGLSQSITQQVTPTGTSWSTAMDLTPLGDGTLTYTAATTDAAGNTGTATAAGTTSKDTAAPMVTGITLTNGGGTQGLGKADQGDTLAIQFSEQIDASKICSAWGNTATHTLSGNGDVTVNISTSSVLTVSSGSCTLNIGSVALGANAKYGTASALSFSGNGNGASSVSWNGTTTLTIKLGRASGGSSGTTTTPDVPAYTAAAGLTDLAGNPLGTGPFPGTNAYRF